MPPSEPPAVPPPPRAEQMIRDVRETDWLRKIRR